MELNAPVLIIPENIYWKDSSYIKLDTGFITVKSNLIEYKEETNYNEQTTDAGLYDEYKVRLDKMNLTLSHNIYLSVQNSNAEDYQIIDNITFEISIENCLGPLNKTYPTLRVNIDFDQIGIDLDLSCLKNILRLKDSVLLDLENKDFTSVEAKIKKKYGEMEREKIKAIKAKENLQQNSQKENMRR